MKYGAELAQHSVPRWKAYNINYNKLKGTIKERTSNLGSGAIAIPGCDPETPLGPLERDLFADFLEQYDDVYNFIQTVYTEIDGRLNDVRKKIRSLTRQIQLNVEKPSPKARLNRVLRLLHDVNQVGEVIESLERFIGAQRTGFEKLLKKVRKWTGSASILVNFERNILDKPESFLKQWERKSPALKSDYTDVIHDARTLYDACRSRTPLPSDLRTMQRKPHTAQRSSTESSPERSVVSLKYPSAAVLHRICRDEPDLHVDAALGTVPLGDKAGRAVYLVHSDCLLHVHIKLLQFSRVRRKNGEEDSPFRSNESSRRSSTGASSKGLADDSRNAVGLIVLGNLQNFVEQQNTATADDIESCPGKATEDSVVSIRYSSQDEAIVTAGLARDQACNESDPDEKTQALTANLRRKSLRKLLDFEASFDVEKNSGQSITDSHTTDQASKIKSDYERLARVRDWLRGHQDIEPLVHIKYGRTRFVGLNNNGAGGLWASLDQNVILKRFSYEDLDNLAQFSAFKDDPKTQRFPYAVLEIRWEGGSIPEVVHDLDNSHVTERVHGFSTIIHAVATICKPVGMPAPFWLPILERDIRKIPQDTPLSRRLSVQTEEFPASTSTRPTSTTDDAAESGFSAAAMESSASSVADQRTASQLELNSKKKKRKQRRPSPPRWQTSGLQSQQYWNEYDNDPEETGHNNEDCEPYTILVYDEPHPLTTFFSNLSSAVNKSTRKVQNWLRMYHHPEKYLPVHESLLHNGYPEDQWRRQSADSSDLEEGSSSAAAAAGILRRASRKRRYNTFPPSDSNSGPRARFLAQDREKLLYHTTVFSFIASYVLLLIVGILLLVPRKRYILEAQIGGAVGVAMSLLCAVVGSLAMLRCSGRVVSKAVVGFLLAVVVVGNVVVGLEIAFERR